MQEGRGTGRTTKMLEACINNVVDANKNVYIGYHDEDIRRFLTGMLKRMLYLSLIHI